MDKRNTVKAPVTKRHPFWKVEGRHFDKLSLARAYAEAEARDQKRKIPIMQKDDPMSPAFVLQWAGEE